MPQGSQYYTTINATTSGGSVSFVERSSTANLELRATRVTVVNTGASSPAYVNFTSTTGATTGDIPIIAGSSEAVTITARRGHYTGLSYTVVAGSDVPLKVIATR